MKEITVKALNSNVDKVVDFVNLQLESFECNVKAQLQIDVAIDELFSNIANYAYEDIEGDATISVDFDSDTRIVSIMFVDSGIPYNPLDKDDPDVTLSAEEREIGGLGIFLVKKSMDTMEYEYKDNKNILTITKKI